MLFGMYKVIIWLGFYDDLDISINIDFIGIFKWNMFLFVHANAE